MPEVVTVPFVPRSLHVRSFWKIHFINPPEVQRQVVRLLVYERNIDDAKVSESPSWVDRKIAEIVPNPQPRHFSELLHE